MTTSTEVLVVGGGPIGLAAAIEARLAGWDVVVVEPRPGTIDKACGEGLMPGTLTALTRLGVDPGGQPLRGISYRSPVGHVDHLFGRAEGRGVRRTTLHAALRERADQVGVRTVAGRVDQVRREPDGRVLAGGVTGRWLLACDGLHSTVRRLVGLEDSATGPRRGAPGARTPGRARAGAHRPVRFGLRRHFRVAPWSDLVEVHWGRDVEAYVTPVGADLVGVAILGSRGMDYAAALAGFPELTGRLGGAAPAGPLRGAGPLLQRSRRRTTGPVRLVGDASGYVDALTGEGLRVGLAQAQAAVANLQDPAAYERAWRTATRDYRLLTTALVAWATSPVRGAIVPVATSAPGVFGWVVDRLAR